MYKTLLECACATFPGDRAEPKEDTLLKPDVQEAIVLLDYIIIISCCGVPNTRYTSESAIAGELCANQ